MIPGTLLSAEKKLPNTKMKLGLCTYLWGKDWDIPTLIKNCKSSGILGVELRVEHAHGVTLDLNAAQRKEVKKQFAGSKIELGVCKGKKAYDKREAIKSRDIARDISRND